MPRLWLLLGTKLVALPLSFLSSDNVDTMQTLDEKKKERCLDMLAECARNGDTEGAHCDADQALLDFIADPEIEKAWLAVDKWYA